MSTSVSSQSSKTPSRRKRRPRRMLVLVCGILVSLFVTAVVLVQGSVSGTEFAPSHFQSREFSFYEIPFLHLQITPVHRNNTTGKVASQLRTSSWIQSPRGQAPSVWHPTSISRGPSTTPLPASLLTDTLKLRDNGKSFWVTWNKDHPKRASVVWPVVQKLAERELYVLIPELMALARSLPGGDIAQPLAEAIDAWLIGQYVDLISDMKAAGRAPIADELLKEALTDYPDSTELAALK